MKKLLLLLCVMCLILTSCTYEEISPAADAVVTGLEDVTGPETTAVSEGGTEPETAPVSEDSTETETSPVSENSTEPEPTEIAEFAGKPVLTAIPETETEPALTTTSQFTGKPVATVPTESDTEPELTDDPNKIETMPADTSAAFTFTVPEQKPTDTKAGSPLPLGGKKLKIDLSKYSKDAKLLTADDIYLMSFHCGYISDSQPYRLIIETRQQLDCALKQYALVPGELMTEQYPISDYSYVIEYVEVGSGGFDLKAGGLVVDTDRLAFVQSEDSRTPDPNSIQTTVMDGFCYMAALPKGTLMNEHYENWTYPESNAY